VANQVFVRSTQLPVDAETAFAWHERPGAFQRLVPPWESLKLVKSGGDIKPGTQVELASHVGPLQMKWIAEHRDYEPGRKFRDVQLSGPFAHWDHVHRFEPGDGRCVLEDAVEYRVPGGLIGRLLGGRYVSAKLAKTFAYRHATTVADLQTHAQYQNRQTMQIAVTGATGLVGSTLLPLLTTGGHEVSPVTRKEDAGAESIHWQPAEDKIDAGAFEGLDAVVHLAGENIASGRWTEEQKAKIRDSRVKGTRLLSETLAGLNNPPKTLICASATGFYGDRGGEVLNEQSAAGEGFLADVCQQWEAAADPAREAGIRVVHARFGVVLSPQGGALAEMLTPFKLGVGGKIGSGQQYWSWVSIDDVAAAVLHLLMTDSLDGPVNVVSPQPVTNKEFTKVLGRVLGRPTIFPLPGFMARLMLGQMADALLLASARVEPSKLQSTGYEFRHPDLEQALRHVLGRTIGEANDAA